MFFYVCYFATNSIPEQKSFIHVSTYFCFFFFFPHSASFTWCFYYFFLFFFIETSKYKHFNVDLDENTCIWILQKIFYYYPKHFFQSINDLLFYIMRKIRIKHLVHTHTQTHTHKRTANAIYTFLRDKIETRYGMDMKWFGGAFVDCFMV